MPFEDLVNDMSPISQCLDANKVPVTMFGDGIWSLQKDAAWHFDTHKFYAYNL